jgi:hypothetical protein
VRNCPLDRDNSWKRLLTPDVPKGEIFIARGCARV